MFAVAWLSDKFSSLKLVIITIGSILGEKPPILKLSRKNPKNHQSTKIMHLKNLYMYSTNHTLYKIIIALHCIY